MSEDAIPKKYPVTTSEVAKMLGLKGSDENLPMGSFSSGKNSHIPGLPVAQEPLAAHIQDEKKAEAHMEKDTGDVSAVEQTASNPPLWIKIVKTAGPYVVVFLVGLFLYYFFFTGVNFSGLFKSSPTPITPKETALQVLEKQNLGTYQAWVKSYYYDVSDAKVIDPEADNSGNGLSNFQKYLLNLNPKAYDTLGLGKPDSQTLADGMNPLTGGQLTDPQKAVLDKYIDMEVVMNRLALTNLQHPQTDPASGTSGLVAGAAANSNGQTYNPSFQQNAQNNNQTNVSNYGFSNSVNSSNSQGNGAPVAIRNVAPVTGANLTSITDSQIDINTDIPGRLEIPSLKINVPVMWTKTVKDFDQDLQSGVVHYPGTALPGQIGTTYIAGHSSNYIWAKGNYNRVFSTLGNLADNTSFKITVVSKAGKDVIFNYVVVRRQEYTPTDQAQFANSGDSVVALSTCWPVNSTAKRLVVFGKLTQVVR